MYLDQCTSDNEAMLIFHKRFQVSEGTSTGTYTTYMYILTT